MIHSAVKGGGSDATQDTYTNRYTMTSLKSISFNDTKLYEQQSNGFCIQTKPF